VLKGERAIMSTGTDEHGLKVKRPDQTQETR
jgi:methionyl-tRNA synthetase